MPGWYGMKHGQKPEMEKNGNRNGKRPQAGQGQKWQKNGPKMANYGKLPQKSIFWPFFGAVFHFDFHFFDFRLLAVFHAIPARHDPKLKGIFTSKS